MTYAGIEVADGMTTGLTWDSLIAGKYNEFERTRKRKALLDYCAKDTQGMVKIVGTL